MIEGRNIVCIASNWHNEPTSKHHLMQMLSKRNHVVWVNHQESRRLEASAGSARSALGKIRQFIRGSVRVSDGMTVVTPLVVPMAGSAATTALNRRLLVRQIRHALRTLQPRPVQLWTFAPDVDYLAGEFDNEAIVYYCVDGFGAFTGKDAKAIMEAEARLAHYADLVVVSSDCLLQVKSSLNPNTVLVTQGVDYQHFVRTADPMLEPAPELAQIPRPILGFWGPIRDWLDMDLLAEIAAARPNWSIVLIGEVATNVSRLSKLQNVHFPGRLPYATLPACAKSIDVGLIPFKVNDLTRALNPAKLREYLSAGLPVVSTPLPEVERYRHAVNIADGAEAFVAACEREVLYPAPEAAESRRRMMAGETWEAKLAEVSAKVMEAVKSRERGAVGQI